MYDVQPIGLRPQTSGSDEMTSQRHYKNRLLSLTSTSGLSPFCCCGLSMPEASALPAGIDGRTVFGLCVVGLRVLRMSVSALCVYLLEVLQAIARALTLSHTHTHTHTHGRTDVERVYTHAPKQHKHYNTQALAEYGSP